MSWFSKLFGSKKKDDDMGRTAEALAIATRKENEAKTQIAALTTQVNTLSASVNDLKGQVANLTANLTNANSQIATLKANALDAADVTALDAYLAANR
jgi:peptidoglycan hydrolase CwlO-like protein